MKTKRLLVALFALASIIGLLAPASAQAQTTKWYCSAGGSGTLSGGSWSGCPLSTNPVPSPGQACSMISATGTVSGFQPWIVTGYASGNCYFRAYLTADVLHKCWTTCLAASTSIVSTSYSSPQTVHVFAIFTAAAKTYIEGLGSSESAFFAAELAKLTAANTASYSQVTWVNSGFSSGASGLCCTGASLTDAIAWAKATNTVLVARDNSGGDITIIYGRYTGDAAYSASAANGIPAVAFAGVNVDQVGSAPPYYIDPASTAAAVGTLMGAGGPGAKAYAYKAGTSPTACNVWWTIGTSSDSNVPTGATITKYFFGAAGQTANPATSLQLGPFPDGDFANQAAACGSIPTAMIAPPPPAGTGSWTNTGYAGGACQFRQYLTDDPGCKVRCNTATYAPQSHVVPDGTTFACLAVSMTGGWSAPDHNFGGVPMGDSNSYGASTVNGNAAGVSVFHNTQIGIH